MNINGKLELVILYSHKNYDGNYEFPPFNMRIIKGKIMYKIDSRE